MRQIKTYCDVCREEIKKGYGVDKGSLKMVGRSSKNETALDRIVWGDLCHACSIELFGLLHKFRGVKKE